MSTLSSRLHKISAQIAPAKWESERYWWHWGSGPDDGMWLEKSGPIDTRPLVERDGECAAWIREVLGLPPEDAASKL